MDSIRAWLESHDLARLEALFAEHQIDLDVLPDLTTADLAEMGIPLGDRKRILRAIQSMADDGQAKAPPAPASTGVDDSIRSHTAAERRQLTIVFCDLVGSTELASTLDPEVLGALIKAYQQCCMEVVQRWGGHLAEFLGDGAVVYFGWPRAHENDAERAVHAALDLERAVAALPTGLAAPLTVRAGIATGVVMVGEIMNEGVAQRDGVVGATPNLAARVQSLAPPGAVAITSQTRLLVGDRFDLENHGLHPLKGMAEPVEVWLVKGVKAHRSRFEARVGGRVAPLVGRRQEMGRLVNAWEESDSEGGRSVIVFGEPGIGKSRLLKALLDHPLCEASPQLGLQCSPFHESTPLRPFVEWLNQEAGIALDTSPVERARKTEEYAARLGLDLSATMPLLASLLSVPLDHRYPALGLSPQVQREQTIRLLISMIRDAMKDEPGIIVVEDLHWADPTTLEVLRRLADEDGVPGLLVMTARNQFESPFDEGTAIRIDLARLEPGLTEEMAVGLSGMKSLPEPLLKAILASSDGVPLFVEELTRALVDSGAVIDAGDRYELVVGEHELAVPATLHDLLVARLDNLPEGRTVAQIASTLGRSFSQKLLQDVVAALGEALDRDLDRLCDAGILSMETRAGDDATYAFRHAMVREAAYHSQLKARRREVHGIVAGVITDRYPAVVESQPEVVAHHYAGGGDPHRASDYMLRAGQRALHVSAIREAIAHLSGGLTLLDGLPPSEARDRSEMRLQASLGTSFMLARGWAAEEVAAAYEAAADLSSAAESTEEAIWSLWGVWVVYNVRGRIGDATEASERIQALADKEGGVDSALLADMMALQVDLYAGRFEQSCQRCESFLRRYDPERHRELKDLYSTDLELVCLVHYAISSWILGETERAEKLARAAEELAERLDHPYSFAWCNTWGVTVDMFQGRTERVARRCESAMRVAGEQEYAYVTALGTMIRGWLAGQLGDLEAGARGMDDGLKAFQATGAEIAVPFFKTLRAEQLVRAGRSAEALRLLDDAATRIRRWGERWQEAEVYRVRGNALSAGNGDPLPAEAEAAYRSAIDIAKAGGAKAWELSASTDYARQLVRAGRRGDAAELLEPILEGCDPAMAMPDAERAREIMGEL
ncbi:MAG: AAA family ATPase [Gemmatimonadota bacterium]